MMYGAVFSWFFPPETSAEGLVTYKLLKSSRYHYDVYASNKAIWGYSKQSNCTSDNIKSYLFNVASFDDWKNMCLNSFYLNQDEYDFIMSRSMPPESHEIALNIKRRNPKKFWIASFGDPLSFNPYEITNIVLGKKFIPKLMKEYMLNNPREWLGVLEKLNLYKKNILIKMIDLEKEVFEKADLLIFPNIQQCRYSLNKDFSRYRDKCLIVPHSFDLNMIPMNENNLLHENFVFLYTGHLDTHRNPYSIIRAYERILKIEPQIAKKIEIRFVGNMPQKYKNMIYIRSLYKNIVVCEPVDYYTSLKMMQKADCLIHIDAKFNYKYNSNIFFASKLVDYMGSFKPILGITAKNSPAYAILDESHNRIHEIEDINGIANSMIDYYKHKINVDYEQYKKYDSHIVANFYDDELERRIKAKIDGGKSNF